VKWHDGKPFTAEDVKYSLEKMADPKRARQTAKLFTRFERAEVVDEYTVKAYLSAPQSSFLNFLTLPFCKILPKHILEKGYDHKSTDWVVGTGPFTLKKHEKKIMWEVERYADYHHKGLPYLDGIVNYFMTDMDARLSAIIAKRVDMSAPALALETETEAEAIKASAPEVIVEPYVSANLRMVRFGFKNPDTPLQDPRVRRAIVLVADQKELMIAGTGGVERCAPGGFLYPFGPFALPDKELASYLGTDKTKDERVAEAKRLMAEAGWSKGFELGALTDVGPERRRLAEMLGEQLRPIGIKLRINVQESATYIKTRLRGDFDVQMASTVAPLGQPDEQVGSWDTNHPRNYGGYSNPKVDELYRRSTELTGEERLKVVQDLERELWANPPAVPAYYYGYIVARWPYVKGFRNPGALDFNIGLMDKVWLDK
jgi:peptide/nickel transport system substrate-binding protein